ncbi:MAG: hypothetical protein ACRDKL_07675, partial [Solirubrobacteraceae bacterium]
TSALGAATLIALQCGISYWFYLYIVWFFPLVVVALVLAHPPWPGEREEQARAAFVPPPSALRIRAVPGSG